MIQRTSLYIAARFCDWRARAALQSHRRWLKRAEKLFRRIGGGK
jgi:hypothetical protein